MTHRDGSVMEREFLSRTDLRELGLERRAVDAVFRGCPVIVMPGYRRPLIRVGDFAAFLSQHTYDGTKVRSGRSSL